MATLKRATENKPTQRGVNPKVGLNPKGVKKKKKIY